MKIEIGEISEWVIGEVKICVMEAAFIEEMARMTMESLANIGYSILIT